MNKDLNYISSILSTTSQLSPAQQSQIIVSLNNLKTFIKKINDNTDLEMQLKELTEMNEQLATTIKTLEERLMTASDNESDYKNQIRTLKAQLTKAKNKNEQSD